MILRTVGIHGCASMVMIKTRHHPDGNYLQKETGYGGIFQSLSTDIAISSLINNETFSVTPDKLTALHRMSE